MLGVAAVLDLTGLPSRIVAEYIRRGHFPAPRKIGDFVGWSAHEVRAWLDCRAQSAWAAARASR